MNITSVELAQLPRNPPEHYRYFASGALTKNFSELVLRVVKESRSVALVLICMCYLLISF
jgi:hypothetical protein